MRRRLQMDNAQIVRFRVYPESVHGFYFDVEVYPTQKQMQKRAERLKPHLHGGFMDTDAAVLGFSKGYVGADGRCVWSKTLGTIVFHRERLGVNVISHECTHAALRWMEAMKFNVTDRGENYVEGEASDNEERFCYALGRMTAAIGDQFWKYDLWQ